MNRRAVKTFDIEEGSTSDMWYEIRVLFRGKLVETFRRETMAAAIRDFENAGYQIRFFEK